MSEPAVFGPATRTLAGLAAVLFAVLGVILFAAPGWAADRFAWKVSDFVAMTIGGWSLGTAVFAGMIAAVPRIAHSYACLAYLGTFGLLELAVVIWHRDVLNTEPVLAWMYLGALDAALLAGLSGAFDAWRQRPIAADENEPRVPSWFGIAVLAFIVIVAVLAVGAFIAPDGSVKDSNIFPESGVSKFTFRAFGAFYGALVVGAACLVRERRARPILAYVWSGIALIVPITVAALVYVNRFDLGRRPGRVFYIALYIIVLLAVLPLIWQSRRYARSATERASATSSLR